MGKIWGGTKNKMKRTVLLLIVDAGENGCLGKVAVYLPHPSTKTSFISSHNYSGSDQRDVRHERASPNLPGIPRHGDARPVSLLVFRQLSG